MSITSSNNLAVNNSLTVSGNTILGTNATSTLICNATASIINGMSISGNINQTGSTTFSTGTGNISLNGDVIISTNKKLTTSTAQTTINSLYTRINGSVSIMNAKELYFVDETYSNYLKILHDGTNGYFDYTGIVYFRKDGSVNVFSLNSNGQVTFHDTLNTTGITNTGAINSTGNIYLSVGKSLYIGQSNYIRIHHSGGGSVIDYTDGLYFRNSGTTASLFFNNTSNQATFNYNLNTYGIINNTTELKNNSTLNQVGNASFGGTITSTGLIQANYDIRVLSGNSLYVTNAGLTNYLRIHHTGTGGMSIVDYTGGLFFRNTGTTETFKISDTNNQGTFNYNLNTTGITNGTNAIINNGILTQNSTANINSDLNVSGIAFLNCSGTMPIGSTGSTRGTSFYWNPANIGMGDSAFLNYGQSGAGGFSFYTTNNGTPALSGPTQLMKLDSSKNLSLLNNISCASITCSGTIQGATINNTGSIYMDNASPIYLKSLTDTKNYIKYDSTYDGPQIGFLTGVSLKCTDNDSIIFNASKTKANVNVDTSINGTINGTKYLTFKGYTYNNATYGTTLYFYNIYDGTEGSSSNVTMTIPENCYNIKLNTAFASSYPSNTVEGTKEIIMHKSYSGTWSFHTAFQFNSTTYHPTYSIASTTLTITFPTNTSLTGFIRWSNCVTIF
jgi:hypothetical protein